MPYPVKDCETLLELAADHVIYAFQPIVHTNTGATYAVEALLRGYEDFGFQSIAAVFDCAAELNCLSSLDRLLRKKAITAFAALPFSDQIKLFYNLDGRIFEEDDASPEWSLSMLSYHNLDPSRCVFELSERYNNSDAEYFSVYMNTLRASGIHIAIDDFGRGFSEMKMLYDQRAEYLKIDRYFVDGISVSNKKRLFVSSIVNLAHVLGLQIVAEGVETVNDYMECKAIGCDLIQGYYVSRPQTDHSQIKAKYPHIGTALSKDRRSQANATLNLADWVTCIAPLRNDEGIQAALDRFRQDSNFRIIPVVDQQGCASGILKDADFKKYLYSHFGWDLLQNKSIANSVQSFLHNCPVMDLNLTTKTLLEFFSVTDITDGLIITDGGQYYGYLASETIVRLLSTVNLAEAREQNPLTGMAGNNRVNDYIVSLLNLSAISTVVYFDFNQFKPFNDTYGFRQGDRAIILFADILQKRYADKKDIFIGHIGGDDFFLGWKGTRAQDIASIIEETVEEFNTSIESFYTEEDRLKGRLIMQDREGVMREFKLMTIAAALVEVNGYGCEALDALGRRIAKAKKQSKLSEKSFCMREVAM